MGNTDTALVAYDVESAAVVAHASASMREQERKALIKRTAMATHASDDEFQLFLAVADRLGLDPLTRQIYAIHRRSGKDDHGADKFQMTIQTGIDGFAAIAERTRVYAGADDIVFDREDAEHPNKATATVYRLVQGQRVPFTASARWSEYAQRKPVWRDRKPAYENGQPVYELTGKWADMPYNMLGKCALAKALRMAFPAQLSGVYTDDEMGQADNVPALQQQHASVEPAAATPAVRPAHIIDHIDEPATPRAQEATVSAQEWDNLKARMRTELGLTTVALAKTFIRAHVKHDLGGALPTLAEFDKLIAGVNRAAAQKRAAQSSLSRTARPIEPEPEPEPAPAEDDSDDALAEAQADYEATLAAEASEDDSGPSEANGHDLHRLKVPGARH